jgi:hypothetical protein
MNKTFKSSKKCFYFFPFAVIINAGQQAVIADLLLSHLGERAIRPALLMVESLSD